MEQFNLTTGVETPQQEDPKYVEAMLAAADKAAGTPTAEPQQPTQDDSKLYAGKYKSIEELEKGYAELQKAFSKRNEPAQQDQKETKAEADNPLKIDETEASDVMESKGLNLETFTQEFQEKGELSKESYETLAKAGIPQEMVDAYIEGIQLKAAQMTTRVFDTAGGEESYQKMIEWAKTGMPVSERKVYNETFETGDINKILLAVKGLKASYEDAFGRQPQLLNSEGSSGGVSGFNSKAEMKAAMSDPRYSKDPAYRKEVETKVLHSTFF